MKPIRIHRQVLKELEKLDVFTRNDIAELLARVASGVSLEMPTSRPMPSVAHGVHELRVKGKAGQYRVFYFVKFADAILVFHFFKKATQATPGREIETALKRLSDMK